MLYSNATIFYILNIALINCILLQSEIKVKTIDKLTPKTRSNVDVISFFR